MPASGDTAPLLRADNLAIEFQSSGGRVSAVDDVSFAVNEGEIFGVIGESGSGKSTLGRALVDLEPPTRGRVLHQGSELRQLPTAARRKLRRGYQMIFQDPSAALNPRMSILDSVREPLDIAGLGTRAERDARALQALARVGIRPDMARRYPHQISGGQKQRVTIARALVLRPRVLVCDEVVAALDVSIQAEVLNLFVDLLREFGLTYVFITHNLAAVAHIADRIAVMYLGRIVEMGTAADICERPLHPYTEALFSAEPIPLPPSAQTARRIVLQGEIPSPIEPPSGCRFRTRCAHAQERCAQETPEWREASAGHWVACHFAGEVTGITRADAQPA